MTSAAWNDHNSDDAPRTGAKRDFSLDRRNPSVPARVRIPVTVTKVLIDIIGEDTFEFGESIMGQPLDRHIEQEVGIREQAWRKGQGQSQARQQWRGTWNDRKRREVPSVEQYGRGPLIWFASEKEVRSHIQIIARIHAHVQAERSAMTAHEHTTVDGEQMAKQEGACMKYLKDLFHEVVRPTIGWRDGARTLSEDELRAWWAAAIHEGEEMQRSRFIDQDRYFIRMPLTLVEWCMDSDMRVWRKVQARVAGGYASTVGPVVELTRSDLESIIVSRDSFRQTKSKAGPENARRQAWDFLYDVLVEATDSTMRPIPPRVKRKRSPGVRDALAELSGVSERRAYRKIEKREFGTIPDPVMSEQARGLLAKQRTEEIRTEALHKRAGLIDPQEEPTTAEEQAEIEEFDRDERRQQKMNAWFDKHGDKTKAQVDEEERQKAEDEGQIH